VRLLLLAPPGAGKGTQGERLAAWSGARHIAAGDLLRAQARAGGPLGAEIASYQARGDLVPGQIVLDVLIPVVTDAAAHGGYIVRVRLSWMAKPRVSIGRAARNAHRARSSGHIHWCQPTAADGCTAEAKSG
jgi:cytidylate kinase